ncbi:HpcH/HpaI aldolase/citrate lyase family protein [Luteimonas saliphila]|uniref:HpcH/HpaI aldolase/citrate lyase family protein n=1 Tax=Luteimonas saliphila TaxID=2804919 RepID=UPI00192D6092|nr:aldolase/citrate lyase family protein [Luteimonas saliphila]
MTHSIPAWRSLLFVPADDAKRCAKACGVGADAVILDLEDGVAPVAKTAARRALPAAARALRDAGAGVVVRINGGWRDAFADLDAAVAAGVDAVMVPKAEDSARLRVIDELLGEFEAGHDVDAGTTGIVALVESAAALTVLQALAAAPRVIALALGTEDFCVGLGVAPTPAVLELPSRQIALAASVRGQMALAVPLSIASFRDTGAYAAAVAAGAAWGVNGAICIHPLQVGLANEGFGVDTDALAQAQRILDAWDGRAHGTAVVSLDGRMIDPPVAERARRLLARGRRGQDGGGDRSRLRREIPPAAPF